MSIRVLKVHREAAVGALTGGPYATIEEAADAVATAVVHADTGTRYVVITRAGSAVYAYGPYAGYKTASRALQSGLMLGTEAMILAMRPVPRRGHE